MSLEISRARKDGQEVLAVSGALDSSNAAQFETALMGMIEKGAVPQ